MDYLSKHGEQPRTYTPVDDREVEPGVTYTGRIFACASCKKLTGFRVAAQNVPCCSEECRVVVESPVSSEVEQRLDMAEVAGSTPAPGTTIN